MATTSHVSRRSLLTAAASTMAGTAVVASPLALAKGVGARSGGSGSDPIFALIQAHRNAAIERQDASDARDEIEAERFGGPRILDRGEFMRRRSEHPDYAAAVSRGAQAIEAEGEAFNAILAAVRTATPAGLLAFARYACELTSETEGAAVEGASPAYRALAAFAGLPVFGAALD